MADSMKKVYFIAFLSVVSLIDALPRSPGKMSLLSNLPIPSKSTIPIDDEKPAFCPYVPSSFDDMECPPTTEGTNLILCLSDSDCERSQKCCSDGCTKQCMLLPNAVTEKMPTEKTLQRVDLVVEDEERVPEKPTSLCPAANKDIICCMVGEKHDCQEDYDCEGSKICCAKDCLLRCVDPVIPDKPYRSKRPSIKEHRIKEIKPSNFPISA